VAENAAAIDLYNFIIYYIILKFLYLLFRSISSDQRSVCLLPAAL